MSSAGPGGSRDALTVHRAVCAGERRSVRPLAAASRKPCTRVPPHWASSEEAVMQYAPARLPGTPPGGLTAGIDWASADHAVCVVGAAGVVAGRFGVEHPAGGLRALVSRLAGAGVREAAIERGDGPVVDALLEAGVTVVVITPRQVKNLRARYGAARNKDDRFDAFVLADVLRTDRARLRPLIPDSPATTTLRQACRARQDLVRHRVAVGNQLRAHLLCAFPGMVGLFSRLDSAVSLAFLARFDCQDRAGWLSEKRLAAWLDSAGYSGRTSPAELSRRLRSAPRGATGQHGAASAQVTPRPGRRVRQSQHPDQGPGNPDRRPARRARRRPRLHLAAPLGHRARRPAARRDRRLPGPVPRPPGADLPGRGRAVHPPVRQAQGRHLPLGGQQAAARRGLRLRRRLPPRQPLGRKDLQRRDRPRQRPPPRDTDPRPRLALRDLAVLAKRRLLRPGPPPRPPATTGPPRHRRRASRLTGK